MVKRFFLIFSLPLLISFFIFRRYFFEGAIPIPADILTAGYYPWADSSWGYLTRVPIKNSLPADVFALIYPWRLQAFEILKSGYLPLWDNTILLGVPLFANFQASLLNPINFLFVLLPFNTAWAWQIILQPLLLFAAMYLYLSNLKITKYAAILGGVFFTFSGYSLVWLEYNTIIYTLIYFPLILYFVDKITEKPRVVWSLLVGTTLSLQIFSGYPLNSFYTIGTAIIYFIYRSYFNRTNLTFKVFILTLGVITGIAVAAIQLLPGQELASLSIRSFDMSAQAASIKYLPVKNLYSFFVPDFFGNPGTQNYFGGGSYDNFAFFLPVVGIYLFLLSLVTKIAFKKENLIFIVFCFLALLYALPNPVSRILENVQLIGLDSSVNARILFVYTFSASVLAALAIDHVLRNKLTLFQKLVPFVVFVGMGVSALIASEQAKNLMYNIDNLAISNINPGNDFIDAVAQAREDIQVAINNSIISIRNVVIPIFLAFLTFIILLINKRLVTLIALPILVIATVHNFDKYLSFTKSDLVFPKVESIDKLKSLTDAHRFDREKAEIFPANSWSAYNLKSPSGQDSLSPLSTVRYLELINRGEQNDKLLTRFVHVNNTKSPLFDTLDVETYAYLDRHEKESIPFKDGRPFPWIIPEKFTEIANEGTLRIYKNTQNLGTAWFTKEIICEKDLAKTSEILTDKLFNPQEETVVDCSGEQTDGEVGSVEQVSETQNSISFKAKTDTDNYLIVSRANYPGWKAYVDGRESQINSANIALMAIPVSSGEHFVELKYEPKSVKFGAIISFLTLVVWGVYYAFKRIF